MSSMRFFLIILSTPERETWAREMTALVTESAQAPVVIAGSPQEAATYLAQNSLTPSHILLDIGARGQDILPEIDQLAQQCEAGTRVLAVGDVNDVILYRGLISRGVMDYLPMPVPASEVVRLLTVVPVAPVAPAVPAQAAPAQAAPAPVMPGSTIPGAEKRVISFLSAASGDGASVSALNTAFAISQIYNGTTILVDMDYQFGMVAKNLNLQNQYGIGDLFDHPDRTLDAMLIKRMVATYGNLHVITAPADLRYMPTVSAESIQALIMTLKMSYDNVILDLPHAWVPWIASCLQHSTHVVLVAQLWLKSVSHAARMARVFRDLSVPSDAIHTVINRSGGRFKEAVDPKDFVRVYGAPIRYNLANDIKATVDAISAARTIVEMGPSALANDIQNMARGLCGLKDSGSSSAPAAKTGGLLSRLKG